MLTITRRLLFLILGFLLLACTGLNAHAQQPTPTPDRRQMPIRIITTPDRLKTPPVGVLPAGIYGAIRWRKELGLPPAFGEDGPTENSCEDAIDVFIYYDPGPRGGQSSNLARKEAKVTEENGYYACRYSIAEEDLTNTPIFNHPLTVKPELAYLTIPDNAIPGVTRGMTWAGATQPRWSGFQYVIMDSPRTITLTEAQPRAEVNFEIVLTRVGPSPVQRPALTRPR